MDDRVRCPKGHLVCDLCTTCPCSGGIWGTGRVRTDKTGQTLCSDCRHDRDQGIHTRAF